MKTTKQKIMFVVGVILILIGLEMLIGEFRMKKRKQSKLMLGIIGILSGLLCGLYGIGALLGAASGLLLTRPFARKANLTLAPAAWGRDAAGIYCAWQF